MMGFLYPTDNNLVLCTTIETNRIYSDIMKNAPSPKERADVFKNWFPMVPDVPLYITIEPIIDFDTEEFVSMLYDLPARQINIGADSGNNNLPEPSKEKVLDLIARVQRFADVICKPNLKRIIG